MSCKTTFELHHDFPKLAEESGFTFNTHKPKVHIEWRKIKLIDIENLIRDRKFAVVEQHINDILDCVLESEFDVRILDDGFLKIFRLAQLAVEYQQFCRHYLDRSVLVLREEVTNLMQELDSTKRNLREKEEEIKKIRKKSKHFVRTPLPYGNENIAAMILKTLNQSKGDIFNSTSQLNAIQYNKCSYCEKVFLNQLYLKGHISRRHGNVLDIPQRDVTVNNPTIDHTNEKLNNEVSELKLKLKQMEDFIENSRNFENPTTEQAAPAKVDTLNVNNTESTKSENKDTKDPEVLTNEEGLILEKIEQWKKEEHDKYNEEIKLLRQQIIDIISNKEKQDQTAVKNELKMIEELHSTIKLQGDEIITLKRKLLNEESIQVEKRNEIEAQMSYWIKQAEVQSTEYKSLLQKLNDVANEAREYRAQANAEKEKADNLQLLLQRHLNNTSSEHSNTKQGHENPEEKAEVEHEPLKTKNTHRSLTADVITLKKLQQKAQELLNLDQSSSSDNSNTGDVKFNPKNKHNKEENIVTNKNKQIYDNKYNKTILPRSKAHFQSSDKSDEVDKKNREEKKVKNKRKPDSHPPRKENGFAHVPVSPIKVVRAKITEEVNNRLISLGVDPLKNRIPQNIFRKQRKLLQEQHQAKTKKNPSREKILHSIMTHLDQNTAPTSYSQGSHSVYVSPNKFSKSFSLSSVLSNVKSKALSLVKSNESTYKNSKSHDELTKTAIALLKTPPDSANSSPIKQRRSSVTLPDKNILDISEARTSTTRQKSRLVNQNNNKRREESSEESTESSEENEYNQNNEAKQNLEHTSKIINSLINSPARRPDDNINGNYAKYKSEHISPSKTENINKQFFVEKDKNSSNGIESIKHTSPEKNASFENIASPKHTKGLLKNASSISSLNKKKVLFDMDAIQMKSVSASPSQSITDKSDKNEQYELGIVNLDTEEWDISSIENEPLKSTTKIQISRTSPKIAELKQTIESQLTRRNPKLSTTIIGGVDVLTTPIQKASFGGSNTSLGSSILDDDSAPITNHNAFVKPKKITEKDDSEIEISDLIADTIVNKSYNKSF